MTLTQENRMMHISTPLGVDVVLLTFFSGNEGLCVPFSFEMTLVSENSRIAFDQIIGGNVTVAIGTEEGSARFFNGLISSFSQDSGAGDSGLARYSATLVPWFWLLTKTTNSRVFQKKTVPEIVEQVFTEKKFTDFRMDLGSYEPKEYCVQYAETDFNFVSRLLEQEGIFYFFQHENKKHTMVLGDAPDKHPDCPYAKPVRFHPLSVGGTPPDDVITDYDKRQEIRIGKYIVNDFNPETPNVDLMVGVDCQTPLGPGKREVYDFPAEYKTRAEGERLANIRMQAEEVRTTSFAGASTCTGFSGGYKYDLAGHFRDELNDHKYVITAVNHRASETAGGSGQGGGSSYTYGNSFTCVPHDVPYRPSLITPKPMIAGVQTAIVVGPEGEQIHTDDEGYGRVKVQFHWDRARQYNEKSSCWVRVSQSWAGTGWGTLFLPRIGHEVIVSFLESDPDRPIITGCVYNGSNTPPYLPDQKTRSTIKSMSVPDTGGVNEIRFEDEAGKEQLFIQAEKTLDTRAKGPSREFVGGKRHLIVKEDRLELVEIDKNLTVKGDHKEKVSGTISIQSESGDILEKAGMNYALDASGDVHIKGGTKVVIEGGVQVSLKVGSNFIDINTAGVFIKGSMVNINSGGLAGSGSGCSPASPDEPEEADTTEPGRTSELPSLTPSEVEATELTPQALTFNQAAQSGTPFCET
jgi:type VI secretion system secreted protein VgrG